MSVRAVTVLLSALLLVVSGCSGDQEPHRAEQVGAERTESTSPTPSREPSRRPAPSSPRQTAPAQPDQRYAALPTRADLARAAARVQKMTLPELAGQVIVARYSGTSAPVAMVRDLHLGGVIVFDDNVASTSQITSSNRTLRRQAGRPLFVGVDQEGGAVERVQAGATRFPTFMSAGAARKPALTRAAAQGSGAELNQMGFDAVFAPSADVTSGADDPTIGSRSAGTNPALVSTQVQASLGGFTSSGILPVVKHFPGHGSVPTDSHEELPVQTRSRAQLARVDLRPFRDAIAAGAPAIMTGHLAVRVLDPGTPASLSHKVTTGLLREQMGFRGLIITDALDMAGITAQNGSAAAAVRALRAGADVLLMPADPAAAREGIVRAVRNGSLSRARLAGAATRMLASLAHQQNRKQMRAAPGSRGGASAALSRAAITRVAGPCSGRLVGPRVRIVGSAPEHAEAFRAAARRAGLRVGPGGTPVALIGWGGGPARADVVVALDTPYALSRSRARVKLATFGDTPGAMDALVRVLLGKAKAPGVLPVPTSLRRDGPGVRCRRR